MYIIDYYCIFMIAIKPTVLEVTGNQLIASLGPEVCARRQLWPDALTLIQEMPKMEVRFAPERGDGEEMRTIIKTIMDHMDMGQYL